MNCRCTTFVLIAVAALCGGPAFGSDDPAGAAGAGEQVVFLAQLAALILAGRLLGEAMQRLGQPSAMGQLIAGILLGPSLLGWVWPGLEHWAFPSGQHGMLDAVSQFGILLLLLLTGMETDLKLIRKVGRAAVSISILGVAVPFACGAGLGAFIPASFLANPNNRLLTSLFLGTALSISSIKVVATVVREMNFTRRNLGQVILASAIMEDTMGWIIIAIIFGVAAGATFDVLLVAERLFGITAFLLVSFTFGRSAVFWLIRFANDNFVGEFSVITTILVIMLGMGLITELIGVQSVLGAFVAGMLIGESPILSKHIEEELRGLVTAFFMPVFFGVAGLRADLTAFRQPSVLLMTLGLVLIASLGKFAGAFMGGAIGGLKRTESAALACAMNARGSTEVIVATIGLSMGALSQNLFTMIVAMAATTTMIMPPMLRWALRRVPLRRAERERLEREEMEARGFVPNLERLLLAVDDSQNGKFALRLAGHLAGARGLPITVLPLAANGRGTARTAPEEETRAQSQTAEGAVKAAANDAKKGEAQQDKERSDVDVTVRKTSQKPNTPPSELVAEEARKGYDLLFVGLKTMRAKDGGFHSKVNAVALAFEGPLAIVAARGVHLEASTQVPLDILVPVNGTDVSRRAAELAIATARVLTARVTVLYVSNVRAGRFARRGGLRARRQEQAILKETVELADQYDLQIRTAMRSDVAPDHAILTEAKRGRHNIIVMGVSRRSGDALFFGDTAASVFEHSPESILFVAS